MKKEMDCHQALRITHILFYSGLGLMLLSIAVGAMTNSTVVMVVLGLLGGVGAVAGLNRSDRPADLEKANHLRDILTELIFMREEWRHANRPGN